MGFLGFLLHQKLNENGGVHLMGEGLSEEETSSEHKPVRVEEANRSPFLADGIQHSVLNPSFSVNIEKDTYPEQNLEGFVSSLDAVSHEEDSVVIGVESESITSDREKEDGHDKQVFVDKMKKNTDPAEESQNASINFSHESKGDTSPTEILYGKDECHCKQLEEVFYVKGIVVDDQEEGISSLQEYRMKGSSIEGQIEPYGMAMNENSTLEFESFKRYLYESYVEKDILRLLLADQTQLNEDFHHHSSFEGHGPFTLVNEPQKSKTMVNKELENDETENNRTSEKKEIEQEHVEFCDFKSEHHKSREGTLDLSKELAICRCTLDALQKENSTLLANLVSETDARKNLAEEVEILSSEKMELTSALMVETDATTRMAEVRELLYNENMILLSELRAKEEKLQITLEREVKLQDSLRELGSCFEQLLEENIYLSCSLDINEAKLKEIRSWMFESNFHGQNGQISNCELTNCTPDISQTFYEESNMNVSSGKKSKLNSLSEEDMSLLQKVDGEVSDSHTLLNALKEQLQEAKSKLQDLEKSIQGMHSHSLSFSKPGGSPTTAGVSKLIKAFESKSNHMGSDEDEVPLIVSGRQDDSYTLSIEQTLSLHNILNMMELKLESVEIHAMGNQNNKEVLKKLKMDCQSQKNQNNSLQVAFDGLANKVVSYDLQIQDTLKYIDEIHQHVNEEAAGFLNKIEFLKAEVSEDVFALKQERDFVLGIILEAVGKLDACTGLKVLEDLDTRSHVVDSVDTAILSIKNLHGKLEEFDQNYKTLQDSHEKLNRLFMDIQGKYSLAIQLFFKFYSNLMELKNGAHQNAMHADFDEVLEILPGKCDMVVSYLRELLSEHVYLLSRNKELDLDLSSRNHEVEELTTQLKELDIQKNIRVELESILLIQTNEIEEVKRRCLILASKLKNHESSKDLYGYSNSCERGEVAVTEDADDIVHSCNSVLLWLEESVAYHLHNYEEIVEEIILSRKHLHDADMLVEISLDNCFIRLPTLLSQVVIPKVFKLHENQKLLTVSIVEKDSEIQILKENKGKLEDALEASYTELQLKSSEIEQLEQKLSSVREKLSVAVAKGKGLLLQRDSLKQALMERTSELEKSTQDLLLKEGLLEELEVKLKSCSEVERIEALESELSYIRNSATALRDSFLQKDSMLQRIEEVLEDLDLPDDFHDKDILEKMEMLFKFASVHPSTLTDLEQRSLEDHAHSDSGEGTANNSNPDVDELKIKLEELQGKFYNLAEHSDMLEQSLLERNNLVHKWEEILGRIGLPSHMQTMKPEDKIEWLEKELSEVKQERDALQLKIDNLEIYSDMLIGDVEESHKKISELAAEIVSVKSDREFFSENLENLRFEYLALSEKAVQDEQDRENLLKELYDVQDKLIDNAQLEYYKGMEHSLQKNYDLVNSTLTESDKVDFLSGCNLAENLEKSLKKLTDIYTAHLNKSSYRVQDNDALFTENCTYHGKMVPEEALLDKESDLASMKLELDLAFKNLASVLQERNSIFVNCESLMLEIVDLNMQIHLLDMEKNEDLGKYQFVMLELDAVSKQRDFVQEQFTQEVKKSASFKEKLNLAVRKGKGLVQQRDNLKQTVDELNASLEQLKINHSQQTETLISEKSLLMNQVAEMELNLQDKNQNYSKLLTAVQAIDLEGEDNEGDPVDKLRMVSSIILDVRSQAAAAKLEANRSKSAAELLLAELNEIQERNDSLQEELVKKEASLVEYSAQKDESLSRLELFMSVYTVERGRIANNLVEFMSGIDHLKKGLLWSSRILAKFLNKDVNLFHYLEDLKESSFDTFCSPDQNNQPSSLLSNIVSSKDEDISWPSFEISQYQMHQHLDENSLFEHFAFAIQSLHGCMSHFDELREHICKHSELLDKKKVYLSETIDAIKRKNLTFKDSSESLNRDIKHLESKLKEKDAKISSLYKNLTLLYEACSTSVLEIVSRKLRITGNSVTVGEGFGNPGIVWKLPSYANLEKDENVYSINDCIKMMAESILSTMKDANCTNELVERTKAELKETVLALQRELHEKDIQMTKVCEELVIQIRDAEAVTKKSMYNLDSSRAQVSILEHKAEALEADRNSLESRLKELQDVEALSKLLQEKINSLTDTINAKDHEIESLMQALDEEESQIETLVRNNKDMENIGQQRTIQLETLEASHTKTMSKLSTTVSKFDELHNLSETLLTEIESLQSQLQQRDSEISFLRQEVTRCTNDVLALQGTSKNYSSEARELLTWMNTMVSRIGGTPLQFNDQEASPIRLCIDIVGEKIASTITELEELRVNVQSKDALLETERGRVQELLLKVQDTEISRHGKALLEQSQVSRAFEKQLSSNSSGALEIEQMVQRNKVSSSPVATHVRSGRKVNNDHIAVSIDSENHGLLVDEDDDKSHGFKSLAMSRLVPRATRPIADKIDGIWVSAERLLMRQPALRLAFLMYWIALHALLASFV
ncbi:hypothetical protein KSP40_PGU008335 [Platanthera guangdongensis]|uniref:A-kinase anchor protein 9 n=1 Tax=Platanthera guangdongensis TaxID=2320717 RepID=A0ABR2MXV1_9ASPA